MSRIYDDLKGAGSKGADPGKDKPAQTDKPEPLDLFAYAAAKQAAEPAPEENPAPAADETPVEEAPAAEGTGTVPETEDVSPTYQEASLFRRGIESRRPLTGVIDPLAGVGARRRKRLPRRVMIALSLVGVVGAVVVVLLLRKERPAYTTDAEAVEEAQRSKKSEPPTFVPMPDPPPRRKEPEVVVSFENLDFKIPGAVVKAEEGIKIITFNAGLFTGGTRLGRDGRRALAAIAKQLSDYGDKLSITVIGCTDNTPMNPGSRYADNEELGLDRARAVIKLLREKGGFSPDVFRSLSYGERWSPYPNDTRASRAKNRTAVLRISCPSC